MRNPEAIASRDRVFLAATLSLTLGLSLCFGFFSLSGSLADLLRGVFGGSLPVWEACAYLALCALFAMLLLPSPKPYWNERRWSSLPFPLFVAFLFGVFDGFPGLMLRPFDGPFLWALAWSSLISPLGEELIFRSGVYRCIEAFFPHQLATATNPLPLCVWGSAFAFSLWHLQNWGDLGAARTLFQCAYTLPVGLWLGWLRWRTGSLAAPLASHMAINVSALLV